MNEVYVFQYISANVQIFVYYCEDLEEAKKELKSAVKDYWEWQFLYKKTI